jgi:pyridoxamine 5'-phosphate oxidase family protein
MFTAAELSFLSALGRGRLSTIGPDGTPQVHPVTFVVGADHLEIGGPRLRESHKYRNIRRDPRVSLVVDDESFGDDRTIEIHGTAELAETSTPLAPGFGTDVIRIRPVRVDACNVETPGHSGRFVG